MLYTALVFVLIWVLVVSVSYYVVVNRYDNKTDLDFGFRVSIFVFLFFGWYVVFIIALMFSFFSAQNKVENILKSVKK